VEYLRLTFDVRRGTTVEKTDFTTKDAKSPKMEFDDLSSGVIGCAIEVHRQLGPGFLESTYEQCLAYELNREEIKRIHEDQLLIDMKLSEVKVGLMINFNVSKLKDGAKRFVL
jgi:hypothetical protein